MASYGVSSHTNSFTELPKDTKAVYSQRMVEYIAFFVCQPMLRDKVARERNAHFFARADKATLRENRYFCVA